MNSVPNGRRFEGMPTKAAHLYRAMVTGEASIVRERFDDFLTIMAHPFGQRRDCPRTPYTIGAHCTQAGVLLLVALGQEQRCVTLDLSSGESLEWSIEAQNDPVSFSIVEKSGQRRGVISALSGCLVAQFDNGWPEKLMPLTRVIEEAEALR